MASRFRRRIAWVAGSLLGSTALAAPALAQDATWSANPTVCPAVTRCDYNAAGNWGLAGVPTGTATFGATTISDVEFVNPVGSPPINIGRFLFTAAAPAYTFRLVSDDLTFTGEGIVNNSSATQTLISGNRSTLRFTNSSSAGNASLIAEGSGGVISFEGTSTAATSLITIGASGFGTLNFSGNSSAGNAIITNPFGNINFFGNGTAANATITNIGGAVFRESSSLGNATITNRTGLRIFNDASGAAATIVNETGGVVDISQVAGGAASTSIGSLSGAGNVTLGGRTLILGNLNRDETISGVISDGGDLGGTGGSLTKLGTGTLTLSGASTYTGATTVNGGRLLLTGSISGAGGTMIGAVTGSNGRLTIQGGGALTSTGAAVIGAFGGTGNVLVTGAGSRWTIGGGLSIGIASTGGATGGIGRLTIENGATVTGNGALLSGNRQDGTDDGRAIVTGTGSVWNSGALSMFSSRAPALLTIAAGGTVNSTNASIAAAMLVTGPGSVWNSGALIIGPNVGANGSPRGDLRIADGAVVNSSSVIVNDDKGGFPSVVIVEGAGSIWNMTSDLLAARQAIDGAFITIRNGGRINVADGTGAVLLGTAGGLASLTIGGGAPGATAGALNAASVQTGANATLSFEYAGSTNIFAPVIAGTGQIFAGSGTTILTGDSGGFAGRTTIFAGATLQLGNGDSSGSLGGNFLNDGSFRIDRAGSLTFAGIISGSGTLTQIGSVVTTLSGVSTYTGATTINGGTLLVTGAIAGSAVTVNTGGTLGGTGTVGTTTITSGGTLSPGLSIGTLNIAGNLSFAAGSSFTAEVGPAAADRVNVTGSATLAGTLKAIATGGTYTAGQFTVLSAASLTGTFGNLVAQGSFSGLAAILRYSGGNVILELAQASGEPVWTGTVSTDWFVNGNWDNNAVPTAATNVAINTRTPNPTVIAATGAASANITIGGASGGTGHLTIQNGGTLTTTGDATIGSNGGTGEVRVTGAGSRWTIGGGLTLAPTAVAGTNASLLVENGGAVTSNGASIGQSATRVGLATVSGSGSSWTTGALTIGGSPSFGQDFLTVRDGGTVTSSEVNLAGRALATGSGTVWTTGELSLFSTTGINPARLVISAGATVNSAGATLGAASAGTSGSSGAVEVNGATWTLSGNLSLGGETFSNSALTIRNGGIVTVVSGSGTVTAGAGGSAVILIGGGAPFAPGTLNAASLSLGATSQLVLSHNSSNHLFTPAIAGTGTVNVTLGTTILTGDGGAFAGTTNILAVGAGTGGVLQIGNGGATGALGGAIVNDNQLIINRTGALTLAGVISGAGALTQNGPVTTTLSAANTYTGATTINGGSLLVTGSIAGSAVTVNNGATLGGTGTVGTTTITSGGTLSPGQSIGTLSIAGNLAFASGSNFTVEVGPAAADRVNVTGSATLAGTLTAISLGGTFAAGTQYTLLNAAGGVSGTFNQLVTQGTFGAGLAPTLSYNGNGVILTVGRSGPTNTATTTFTDTLIFNAPTIIVQRINRFETRIIGRLTGGISLFDQTINEAFGTTAVNNALAAARLAITTAGGPGVVVISDPVLVSRTTSSSTSSVSVFSLAGSSQTVTTVTTFGPATLTIGDARSCGAAIGALPGGTRPTCGTPGGQRFTVEPGTVNINTVTRTDYVVNEARTDTITDTTRETYELTGTVVPVGTVHAAVQSGLFELGGRFLSRMGEEGAAARFGERGETTGGASSLAPAGGGRGWAEFYGYRARADARGGTFAERRDARGLAGGFSLVAGEGLTVGFAVDRSELDLGVPGSGEEADVEMTQLAASARFGSGPFSLGLVFAYGFGNVDSRRTLVGVATAARYDVELVGGTAEIRYMIETGGLRLTPVAALDWVRVGSEAFAETGAFGLAAPDANRSRTRASIGLEAGASIPFEGGARLDLAASGRYAAILSGGERALPVTFNAAPGTPLVMRGLSERDSAIVGAQAAFHLSDRLSIYMAYDGRFAGGYDAHAATGGVRITW